MPEVEYHEEYEPQRLLDGSRLELHAKVEKLEAENQQLRLELGAANQLVADWRRRAVAHGCDAERGDPDCG
jgi:hypothetical protein